MHEETTKFVMMEWPVNGKIQKWICPCIEKRIVNYLPYQLRDWELRVLTPI